MARYIRTDELLKTARNGYHSDFGRSMADLTSLREVVEDTPTADVVEVKHGEWEEQRTIFMDNEITLGFRCTACDLTSSAQSLYCPNCGADMRGGK
jgi:hypothetical protein